MNQAAPEIDTPRAALRQDVYRILKKGDRNAGVVQNSAARSKDDVAVAQCSLASVDGAVILVCHDGGVQATVMHSDPKIAATIWIDGQPIELPCAVGFADATAQILAMFRADTNVKDPSGRLLLEQAVDLLRSQLVRAHSDHWMLDARLPRRGLANWQVKRVTTYMRDRLDQEIGLNELAALVDLSRFHFCTAFRMATGRTPHEWLTHERMARAKTLLANSMLRITDIALSVGYGTPSAFAATFRKVVGQTPTEFRRQL